MAASNLTPARLREVLRYNKRTGLFHWKARDNRHPYNSNPIPGTLAGSIGTYGYVRICIDGRLYEAHRLAYLWVYGEWPPHQIDHKNEVKADNRWCNLRPATPLQNTQYHLNHPNRRK